MAPKYALYIVYCAGISPGYEYRDMAAKDLAQAMREGLEYRKEKENSGFTVYFMQIMTRHTTKSIKVERGLSAHEYHAIAEAYLHGWLPAAHTHFAKRYQNKYDNWYGIY